MNDNRARTSQSVRQLERKDKLRITGDSSQLVLSKCSISEDVRGSDGKRVPIIMANENFLHYTFEDFGARQVQFNNCNFSYSIFTRAYFYGAEFDNCKFIGTRFTDCNFKSARFSQCDFSYSSFRGTTIPSKEVMCNVPTEPNVRRELMQALRANAISLVNDEDAKFFIRQEMRAAELHNQKAREAREGYYAPKYGWATNRWNWMRVRIEYIWLWIQRFGWGYGEYPWRLLRSIALLLLALAILLAMKTGQTITGFIETLLPSVKRILSVFLAIPLPSTQNQIDEGFVIWLLLSLTAVLRYVALGLFVTMLFRRLSKR
jgi:Pentapeptide repeats (9 copies)